ncbi:alpha-ribazole phosphatase family protein [Spirosoma taeanense]|uniref:Alpha-ribazole phosphatase family protein n=1 Tax=Spirosoma taeanense TaxID=2735870 RepID=A0A6M5Y884_9BACT|nr:alpha-ribazole phosphatase family protein [Spirosoma taeanense]QJW89393.1 alpha-ribazole phosphatase family protein [Spirosoma taeanense]
MDIYLIRHTEVSVGRSIAYGQTDVDLTDTYEEQRERLVAHLPNDPAVIFSSPLNRCRRLAEDLASALTQGSPIETAPGQTAVVDAHRPKVQYDDRLKEIHFGDWEMTPWADIGREALDPWMADFVNVPTPNGENFQILFERVAAFWTEQILPLAETTTSQPVFIVSHGGVIRALLCLFLDLSLQNAYRINLDYGAVTKLTLTGSAYTIQYINR